MKSYRWTLIQSTSDWCPYKKRKRYQGRACTEERPCEDKVMSLSPLLSASYWKFLANAIRKGKEKYTDWNVRIKLVVLVGGMFACLFLANDMMSK